MGCDFELIKEEDSGFEQGVETPALLVPSSGLSIASLHQKQQRMEADFAALKELSAKRHETSSLSLLSYPFCSMKTPLAFLFQSCFLLFLKVAIFEHCSDWLFIYF